MTSLSPLRYPGGKQVLSQVLARLIASNDLEDGIYAEPYAGGAGAALALLFSEHVSKLLLNDADPCIFALWDSILNQTEDFIRLVSDTQVTVEEWRKQKAIYTTSGGSSTLEVGFATFFLNRTNRSGIIKNAGPIGGYDQTGTWKVDARFSRKELAKRIERIALYKKRISFHNLDAIDFIKDIKNVPRLFVYFDPPYFVKGRELYLNHYAPEDHRQLATFMKECNDFKWVMSYDKTLDIERLYRTFRQVRFQLSYSATVRRVGEEVLILGKGLKFPREWRETLPRTALQRG